MTSAKMVVLAFVLTGLSVVIGGSVLAYIGYRKAEEKLGVSGETLGRTVSTLTDLEGTVRDIAGDEEGEFGKRAEVLRSAHPFTRPANGALTEDQVRKFIAVKDRLLAVDLEMANDAARSGEEPDAAFLIKWNFFTRMKRLRMVQIEALEEQNMPVEEYNWVHAEIYKVLVSEGAVPEKPSVDTGVTVDETVDRSLRAIDDELANPQTTAERRRDLEELRSRVVAGRDILAGSASDLQESLASIPPENRLLVERYKEDIKRSFMSAIDLDAVDIMRAMETAAAE